MLIENKWRIWKIIKPFIYNGRFSRILLSFNFIFSGKGSRMAKSLFLFIILKNEWPGILNY